MSIQQHPAEPILLVDDEIEALQGTRFTLMTNGINNILDCQDSRDVAPLLAEVARLLEPPGGPVLVTCHSPGWQHDRHVRLWTGR